MKVDVLAQALLCPFLTLAPPPLSITQVTEGKFYCNYEEKQTRFL
jgi:hypothetical protein